VPSSPDTPTAPLLPDPDRLRARIAELAREQAVLRKVLRAMVRGQTSVPASAPSSPAVEAATHG
jgi:hypothetical protein